MPPGCKACLTQRPMKFRKRSARQRSATMSISRPIFWIRERRLRVSTGTEKQRCTGQLNTGVRRSLGYCSSEAPRRTSKIGMVRRRCTMLPKVDI